MTEMLPKHDTHLSPPSLATQRDNCQCTVGQTGQIQPILSWPNWEDGHSSEDTGAPHALSLGATQAPGNNPGNEEARSQRAKHLWWCPQPWVGDMVGPGWLSGGWEMDSLSVILGGVQGGRGFRGLIVPFIFTSALDQNKRSSHYRLFPATGMGSVIPSSMDISLRTTERHSLGWSEPAAPTFSVPHHDPTGSWMVPAVSCKVHSTRLPFSV